MARMQWRHHDRLTLVQGGTNRPMARVQHAVAIPRRRPPSMARRQVYRLRRLGGRALRHIWIVRTVGYHWERLMTMPTPADQAPRMEFTIYLAGLAIGSAYGDLHSGTTDRKRECLDHVKALHPDGEAAYLRGYAMARDLLAVDGPSAQLVTAVRAAVER